jgi:hypothetical protein
MRGAGTNYGRQAIGRALVEHSAENYEVVRTLMEHGGFAR